MWRISKQLRQEKMMSSSSRILWIPNRSTHMYPKRKASNFAKKKFDLVLDNIQSLGYSASTPIQMQAKSTLIQDDVELIASTLDTKQVHAYVSDKKSKLLRQEKTQKNVLE
eukprot:499991_1